MAELTWGKPSQFQKAPAQTALDAAAYSKTADASPVAGKTYYTESSGSYSPVASPQAASMSSYYEKTGWIDLDTPKEGTLQLTTNEGQETTATEEGGEIVDVRYGKTNYTVTWTQFVKRGVPNDFEDEEGVVKEETALRWLPEDPTLPGTYLPRVKVRVSQTFTTADGTLRVYTGRIMKPTNGGKSVQKYNTPSA